MWTYNYNNDYLMHHGVKGMKWGVRKDRYESSRTRQLRTFIGDYDKDIKDPTFSPKAHRMLVKDREKLYKKYNKQKNRDLKRKQFANKHGHVAAYASTTAKGMAIGLGLTAGAVGAFTIASLSAANKGRLPSPSTIQAIQLGTTAAGTVLGSQLLYKEIEQHRAIAERNRNGRYDLKVK